ncbi:hypothetical protein CK203_065530 [Vitis vinifera]|uniref:Uncharacterized protein n=1 Tax=Vitis vinifera TaxID=29760 RepID=A0A438G3N4_VITVI|nr:hypothetical protein CK203_065530 [Vitis vinifera]
MSHINHLEWKTLGERHKPLQVASCNCILSSPLSKSKTFLWLHLGQEFTLIRSESAIRDIDRGRRGNVWDWLRSEHIVGSGMVVGHFSSQRDKMGVSEQIEEARGVVEDFFTRLRFSRFARGLSSHQVNSRRKPERVVELFHGRSKSFSNLLDVNTVADFQKEDNPFNKKRRTLIAYKLLRKNSGFYSWKNPNSMALLTVEEDPNQENNSSEDKEEDKEQKTPLEEVQDLFSSHSNSHPVLGKEVFRKSSGFLGIVPFIITGAFGLGGVGFKMVANGFETGGSECMKANVYL